ncbi:pilus assembly protein TadG-related protein [Novipirellula sp. SH528]|uniref:vWA domain-containing protein n=1 Tax=Novipirellula sp. SH528 TaxID=3454466 RepID=UPI003FA0B248
MLRPKFSSASKRHGGTIVLFAVLMVVIVGMAAFAVDIGRMQLVRSQLQSAVDAGAIAGGLHLKNNPEDIQGAKNVAENFIAKNKVGFVVDVPPEMIALETGNWDPNSETFTLSNTSASAIRVHAVQSNEPFFFAGIFGQSSFSIPRQSIASAPGIPLDIVMVLDLSESMESDGRIEALQQASPEFVEMIEQSLKEDRIGVMGYGARKGRYDPEEEGHSGVMYTASPSSLFPDPDDTSSDWVGILESPMTNDFSALKNNILTNSTLKSGKYGGGTPIGAAVRDGAHYLYANHRKNDSNGNKVKMLMVVMSDGYANKPEDDPDQYAIAMANYASGLGIEIHTISLGDSADISLMTAIANATGGKQFSATGSGSELTNTLKQAYRKIAGTINRTILVQ